MSDAHITHLMARLAVVEDRVRALVAHRRAGDPDPDDPFRGLYLSDEMVDRLLAPEAEDPAITPDARRAAEDGADEAEARGQLLRLRRLARSARLEEVDLDLLLIALLPDLDSRFERLYGYLNDDVTRRRATIGLALELAGASTLSATDRGRLAGGSPLVDSGLVVVDDADRPFLTRAMRVPDRVAAHLLGDDSPDSALLPCLVTVSEYPLPLASAMARALRDGIRVIAIRERDGAVGLCTGVTALAEHGLEAVALDLTRVAQSRDPVETMSIAAREVILRGGGLVAGPVEALAEVSADAIRRTIRLAFPVVFVSRSTWDPAWGDTLPLTLDAPVLAPDAAAALWEHHLGDGAGMDHREVVGHLSLGPDQVRRAVEAARASARFHNRKVSAHDVRKGVRAQNAAGLEHLSRRIEPQVGWVDLILPSQVTDSLLELAARARHRHTVLTQWRMRRGGGRGLGIVALFAGDSGTGKTMSAEVIAADLGLDLYSVNLATVVDKYVGETEKNLERIFAEAGGVNAVLFFDEADAIFGKRSEVRDAHDRYANIESAYLLQRLETFDGLAVLATNLRSNIDEGFTRRLDSIIDFPSPTAEQRLLLWQRCLAPPLPVADDADLDFCAQSFELTGGNIRSASITAAYLAAAGGRPVGMADIVTGVEQEYRKLGRLVLEGEFGDYMRLFT